MRGEPPRKMDPELALRRWRERFTWSDADVQVEKKIAEDEQKEDTQKRVPPEDSSSV